MRLLKCLQACALVTMLASAPVRASSAASEITDLWWNPAESGWGVNVILQNGVAFLTFFVYDAARKPVWYTSDAYLATNDAFAWTGKLYETNGPWFGAPFSPSTVTMRQVGTLTFAVSDLDRATLTYTVDGVTVVKSVERQTWGIENFTGNYLGGYSLRNTNCSPGSFNGIDDANGSIAVAHNGAAMSIAVSTGASNCTFSGTYTQTGKIGQLAGNFACSSGAQGPFTLVEMTPTISGFNGRLVGQSQFCDFSGSLGGITLAP